MSINSRNPSMKRVLNLNQMTHQSIKSNFEIRAKPETDLHRLNSKKSASFLLENKSATTGSFTKYLLKQTSEIDGEEDSLKNNPIFHDDDASKPQATSDKEISESEQVLKIDCEFKHLVRTNLPPPPPPPLPPPLMSQSNQSITNSSQDTLKREDSIKSANDEVKDVKSFSRADSISVKTERQESVKSFKRDESTRENLIHRTYVGGSSFKAFLDRQESLKSYQREDSIKSSRSNHVITKDEIDENDDDVKMRNIFPQVALSEVTYEEDSDDETITKSNFDIDLFSYRMGSLKLVERKNSDIVKEAKSLKTEMNNECLIFELKSIDILYNLIAVSIYQKYWFAGFKNTSQNLLNKIHFGDEILSINDYLLNDVQKESFQLLAKNSTRPLITVKLRRLPYARIILVPDIKKALKESDYEMKLVQKAHADLLADLFGIRLKTNTAKIEKLVEGGLFYRNSLKYDANKVEFDVQLSRSAQTLKVDEKDRITKWVITEINGDSISYRSTAEEIFTRLCVSNVASVIVQPYDLVKSLHKERNKSIFKK